MKARRLSRGSLAPHSRRMRAMALVTSGGLMLQAGATAWAADTVSPMAVALHDRGTLLMAQGKTSEACAALTESSRLDPSAEIFLDLAECHARMSATAAEWSDLRSAVSFARSAENRVALSEAQKRLASLEPSLRYIRIVVPSAKRVPGLQVTLDSVPLNEGAWNTDLPVDPGPHEIIAEAAGYRRAMAKVSADGGARRKTVTIELDRVPDNDARVGVSSGSSRAGSSGIATAAVISGTVGFSGLLGALAFALLARQKWHEYQSDCPNDRCRTQAGIDAAHSSARYALFADVSLGVGVAASALATYLVLRHRRDEVEERSKEGARLFPSASADSLGIVLGGTW
jgi:hypothetical protein